MLIELFGIFNTCPTDNIFDVILFNFFISSTEVLYFVAILYKLSPFCTIYSISTLIGISYFSPKHSNISSLKLFVLIFKTWPTLNILLDKLLSCFNTSILILLFLAIEYKESPFATV